MGAGQKSHRMHRGMDCADDPYAPYGCHEFLARLHRAVQLERLHRAVQLEMADVRWDGNFYSGETFLGSHRFKGQKKLKGLRDVRGVESWSEGN